MRLRFPKALIPATTALATLDAHGREAGILAGANVVMPNLSPFGREGQYSIYDHKASGGSEAAEGLHRLEQDLKNRLPHLIRSRRQSGDMGRKVAVERLDMKIMYDEIGTRRRVYLRRGDT